MTVEFVGQLKQYSTKATVDLSKTTRLTIDTEQMLGKQLDEIAPDQIIKVIIATE